MNFSKKFTVLNSVKIYKIHFSLNFYRNNIETKNRYVFETNIDTNCAYTDIKH